MPKIKNKVTGKTQTVTAEELKAIQENKETKNLFDYINTPEPEEVKSLKDKEAKHGEK